MKNTTSDKPSLSAYLQQSRLLQKAAIGGIGGLTVASLPVVPALGQCGTSSYNATNGEVDVDQDGTSDFAFYTFSENIYVTNLQPLVWQVATGIIVTGYPSVADVDGDDLTSHGSWENGASTANSFILDQDGNTNTQISHVSNPDGFIGVRRADAGFPGGFQYGFIQVQVAADGTSGRTSGNGRNGASQSVDLSRTGVQAAGSPGATGGDCVSISGPLPIELVSFRGEVGSAGNTLVWSTASELNNAGFAVERSSNGEVFHEIAWLEGAGTIKSQTDYSYVDRSSDVGVHYYRLRQKDHDGSFSFSETIAVEQRELSASALRVRPVNPTTGSFEVFLSADTVDDWQIALYTSNGQQISNSTHQTVEGENRIAITAGNVSPGIYFVAVTNGERQYYEKLVFN